MNLDNLTKIVQHEINAIAQVNKLKSLCCQLSITAKDYSTIINISPNFIAQKNLGGSYDTIIHEVSEDNSVHIPADTRSAFPVISVQSPVSIQCCWQS